MDAPDRAEAPVLSRSVPSPGAAALPFFTLGHGTVLVEAGGIRVVVDPWRWDADEPAADLVLVTCDHADRASICDVVPAAGPCGIVVAPPASAARLAEAAGLRGRIVTPAEGTRTVGAKAAAGATVLALPHEGPSRARGFHPRGAGRTYLLELAGHRLLFLGDSDALAEHEGLAPDAAFFSVGGFAACTPEEAAAAAVRVQPRLAVPLGWGDLGARHAAARRFVELCAASGIDAIDVHGR